MQSGDTIDLSSSQVGVGKLPSLYYFPSYIGEDEEQRIMAEVRASQAKWVQVRTLSAVPAHGSAVACSCSSVAKSTVRYARCECMDRQPTINVMPIILN
jgi:hypothetical protein